MPYLFATKPSSWPNLELESKYGESHCTSVGCIIDGVPPGMELGVEDIQPQLTQRRPRQSSLTTPRDEKQNKIEIQSGIEK